MFRPKHKIIMTQEELAKFMNSQFLSVGDRWVAEPRDYPDFTKNLLGFINQHVNEVIGEDEPIESTNAFPIIRNALRDKQRKRAGVNE